ncbi:MAG: hypothetical protein SAMD01599839_16960 [Rectinema sp.]
MSFDYYAHLDKNRVCPENVNDGGLASGFVDGCTVSSSKSTIGSEERSNPKNEARLCYMHRASALKSKLSLPKELHFEPDFSSLQNTLWIGFEIDFTLETPWYSKDDGPFHVMDNPVRKDRVFGVPFMSAASWKGLLRWACRMRSGLSTYFGTHKNSVTGWEDLPWIIHLFGNAKSEREDFRSGALVFYPTWFDSVGFEVINPHDRAHRAGTQPIYYEVVPAKTPGILRLLYAPSPGEADRDGVVAADALVHLVDAIEVLLTTYGISAKRTVGWGTARITSWKGSSKNAEPLGPIEAAGFKTKWMEWLSSIGGAQ